MMPTTLPAMAYSSPKRKRVTCDPDCYSPSAPSPSPSAVSISSLPESLLREEEDLRSHSPRAAVAGRLGELAIRGGQYSRTEPPTSSSSSGAQESVATPASASCWVGSNSDFCNMPGKLSADGGDADSSEPLEFDAKFQNQSENETRMMPGPSTPTSSPRKKRNPPAKPNMRTQRASPPLDTSADENPLTWHDSEITGHEPSDPNDDGYGINGIGFKPTAAMAWARSQRRQRQVAEWRSRETREAREKRRERRDRTDPDKVHSIQHGAIQKKVKFDV